ncbi:GPI anchored protein [Heterostelium album PN500]|uniref:GPI anchored protein n=1 Tax=Heterostelium pallidum (strain ATCC 26659 / Pp 5 / PN500) TaxID=670386 RepID=D3B1J3_HETP5|nr:GPI anchored protein [Heterostelium album PN500]EFA85167.1 GPI anchored protein [Heterostelium album PN500]|eukprot:XP_020437276.1 GPI anchored protein [Heterostelium album PN500]
MAPYTDIPVQKRLLSNNEKARTIFSYLNKYPGMYGAAYQPNVTGGDYNYITGFGIGDLAMARIQEYGFFTPYGAFPVLLANHSVGLTWYHNMLMAPGMQGPYGTTESGSSNGTMIAPLLSWDTKVTGVVAILGGIGDIVRAALKQDNKYNDFYQAINTTYSKYFPSFVGEDIPFQVPNVEVPIKLNEFTLCDDYVPPTPTPTDSLNSASLTLTSSLTIIMMISVLLLLSIV